MKIMDQGKTRMIPMVKKNNTAKKPEKRIQQLQVMRDKVKVDTVLSADDEASFEHLTPTYRSERPVSRRGWQKGVPGHHASAGMLPVAISH